MFNKQIAEQHLNDLLALHKIQVVKWSTTSCGYAYWKTRTIKIPHPTNPDKFGVCMHEVKHIIDGNKGKRYEQEFYCDLYAMEQMKLLGLDVADWVKRMNWHSLSRVAMAHNRGLNKINPDIKKFFANVDWGKWEAKKVFVHCEYKDKANKDGYRISYN